MERTTIVSGDGSSTLFDKRTGECFHSLFGAVQESMHIFINEGWREVSSHGKSEIALLEIGMGTGLNVLLTCLESEKDGKSVRYDAVEPYPITQEEVSQLNYPSFFPEPQVSLLFTKIHSCNWGVPQQITPSFRLTKHRCSALEIDFPPSSFDLVYFDAFSPKVQPDLWGSEMFSLISKTLKPNGILVTYCCKGEVKRILRSLGFEVKKLAGPPGKREVLRARMEKYVSYQ
ncbi:MAG: tRNA (5-methylaminomethyl-2-thiouridine)(34)-methyltransferase MnmD [Prevotellaceae bacterium]|nr:tRNA (5-methylaminomethyl-2-thiouridine)(34)-methyltransferase MnmD [Prevotellaceae bacterium]